MNRPPRIRLAGLVAAAALAATACSSGRTAAIDGPTYRATTTTTSTPSTTIGTTAAGGVEVIELAPVTIDTIAVEAVAPVSWTEDPPGLFTADDGGQLAFGAVRTWLAPNPAEHGLEPVERLQVGDRWWDIHTGGNGELAAVVAVTGDELMQYSLQLAVPAETADLYIDTVAMPVLEAFEVIDPTLHAGVLEAASVDIDGRSVAYATGGTGDATVVLESGWDDGMAVWATVGDDAARLARVFAYDRPGTGHSDPTTGPRDGASIVQELRATLDATGHEPPYVLVGHSLGGLYMELFARTHPDEVAGLVLVDATTAGQVERCIDAMGSPECDPFTDEALDDLPEPGRSEGIGMAVTEDQVGAAPALDAVPTVVLVAGRNEEGPAYDEFWVGLQRERAAELGAELVLAEDSSHYLQADRPDLVLQAIEDVIEQHRRQSSP